MTNDYRPIPQKSIPDREKSADSALAATVTALAIALLLAAIGESSMASGACFGCALTIAVDRVMRRRAGGGA